MKKPLKFTRTRSSLSRLGAYLGLPLVVACAIAGAAFADDTSTITAWGLSPSGGTETPNLAYTEAFKCFALGDGHGISILEPGRVVRGWGRNDDGQLNAPTLPNGVTFTQAACGGAHSALLRSDGQIVCFGSNTFNQCDVATSASAYDLVRCGAFFTLGRNVDGALLAWGDNSAGQATVPPRVSSPIAFSGGLDHAGAVLADGTVILWGDNSQGEGTQPTLGAGVTVTDIVCAWNTTSYLKSDGTVEVVGDNSLLQLEVPTLGKGQTYTQLRAYGYSIAARRSDKQILVWGNNSNNLNEPPLQPVLTVYGDFELGLGFAAQLDFRDCDSNDVSDIEDIATHPTFDCNNDNRIDSCEGGVTTLTGVQVTPYSSSSTASVDGTNLPNAVGDVIVEVEVKADLGSPGEYLTLKFNDQVIDYIFLQGGLNCPTSFQKETIFLPAALYNALLDNGAAHFRLTASALVSSVECPTSAAKVKAHYYYDSADCNFNEKPDSCELAEGTIPDRNSNGIPDTCELKPVSDLDGDGEADIVWFNPTTRQFSVWFMSGRTRTSGGYLDETAPAGFSFGGLGDLDGDGRSDIVERNLTTGAVRGVLMSGTAVAQSGTITGVVPSDYRLLAIADIDRDGNGDILWKSATDNKVYGWKMVGLTKTGSGLIGTATGLTFLGVGDLDADGDADILWRSSTGVVSGWRLDGLTIQAQGDVADAATVGLEWSAAGMADLDGDFKADLLWRNNTTGQVNGWLMDGLTKKSGGVVTTTVGLGYTLATLTDLDGDSKSDIVWRNNSTGDVNVWLMEGLVKRVGAFVRSASLDWRIVNP